MLRKSTPFLNRFKTRESISKMDVSNSVPDFYMPIKVQSCGNSSLEEKVSRSPEKTVDLLRQLINKPKKNMNFGNITALPVIADNPYVAMSKSRQASSTIRYRHKIDLKDNCKSLKQILFV